MYNGFIILFLYNLTFSSHSPPPFMAYFTKYLFTNSIFLYIINLLLLVYLYGKRSFFSVCFYKNISIYRGTKSIEKERKADIPLRFICETKHEKCNSKMEQHQSCIKNPVWSYHWYHSRAGHSKSNCNCSSWRFICWCIEGNCPTPGILPCNERPGTHG